MTTENTNPEQEQGQIITPTIENDQTDDDQEEGELKETTEEIVSRELSTVPFAEKEGVMKYAKDADLIRVSEISKDVKKFKKKYSADKFELKGVDDKEGVDKIFAARKVIRDYRIPVEEEREAKVSPHNATVKYYNERYKPLIAEMKKIEGALKAKEDDFKVLIEKEKQRVAQERRDKIDNRVKSLQQSGAAFDGQYYCVGSAKLGTEEKSIGMIDIETASDTLFDDILIQFKKISDDVAAKEAAEKEKKRLQKIEDDRLETERKQKLIDDQAEVDRKQMLLDDEKKLQEEKTRKFNDRLTNMRRTELLSLGLSHDAVTNNYYYKEPKNGFPFEQPLYEIEDEGWEAALDFIGKKIAEIKEADAAREKLTLARQAELVELGFVPIGQQYVYKTSCRIDVSRFTASEEDWAKVIYYARTCIEKANTPAPVIVSEPVAENKTTEENQPVIESDRPVRNFGGGSGISLSEAHDKQLWKTFTSLLSAVEIPNFKTGRYIALGLGVKEKIKEIISL